jgi:transposase-like protein
MLGHPMDKASIHKLLYLEETNLKLKYDKKVIALLVGYYAKLIEYYDTVRDPMKDYFIEKMQSVMFSLS